MKSIPLTLIIFSSVFFVKPNAVLAQNSFSHERSICNATLTAQSNSARITLRSGPSTNHRSLGYGLVGDFVYILSSSPPEADYGKDSQGYLWYRVGFPRSGAKGWIRKDFLRMQCAYD